MVEAEWLKLQNVKHVKIGKSRKSMKQQGSLQKLSNNSSNVVEIRISFTVVCLLYIYGSFIVCLSKYTLFVATF